MPRFTTRLIDRTEVADGTLAFAFERPAGFEFTAGQYLTLTLPDPLYTDEKGNSRTFSIASPPQDAGRLVIATRMTGSALEAQPGRGAARHAGEHLRPGGRLHARPGPDPGRVHRRRHRHHAVSQHAARCRGARAAAPDHADLLEPHAGGRAVPRGAREPGQDYAAFAYVPTITEADKSPLPWDGERRFVNADFLHDHVGDMTAPIFYLAGPPGLVVAATKTVLEAGAAPTHVLVRGVLGLRKQADRTPAPAADG